MGTICTLCSLAIDTSVGFVFRLACSSLVLSVILPFS